MKRQIIVAFLAADTMACAGPGRAMAQGCTPSPPTAAANAGAYTTKNGQILGPDGKPFVPRGVDVMEGQEPSAATLQADFPGINFVRLAIYDYASPGQLSAYVNDLTSHGIVVELEDHASSDSQNRGGSTGTIFTGQTLQNELNWYSSIGSAFASNPDVWFGTNNEPSEVNPNTGQNDPALLSQWQQQTYQAIRSAGNNNPVMLEANGWSSGGQPVMLQGYNPGAYSSMTNTIWDAHYYGWLTNGSSDPTTNDQFIMEMVQQTNQIPNANGEMPVIIGEYGPSTQGPTPDSNAQAVIDAVQATGLGSVAWAWAQGNPGSDSLLNNDGSLSQFGQQVANYIKNGPSGCFAAITGNITSTPTPTPFVMQSPPANLPPPAGPESDYWSTTNTGPSPLSATSDPLAGIPPASFDSNQTIDTGTPFGPTNTTPLADLPAQVIPEIGGGGSAPVNTPAAAPTQTAQVIPTISNDYAGPQGPSGLTNVSNTANPGTTQIQPSPGDTPQLVTLDGESYGATAVQTAEQLGVNPASVAAIAQAESNFKNVPTANGSTTATGPWQFTQGTFNDVSNSNNLGLPPSSINDPNAQAVEAPYYLQQIATTISQATGSPATTTDAYAGWVFGPDSGAQIANATDDTPLSSIVSAQSLANNGMSSWTVGDFKTAMTSRLGPAATQNVMTTE